MFIIELIYKASLDEIDAHMKAHMVFLNKHYAVGDFIMSGRKVPREGGIIIATGDDKKKINKIIKQDPFYKHKLADYKVIEFLASQSAEGIKAFIK
jgi:uncharacterized protein YciI